MKQNKQILNSQNIGLETNIDKIHNDILIQRLNEACKLIYKKYGTNQFGKVDRTLFSVRKHN
jgi:hypothetical protein